MAPPIFPSALLSRFSPLRHLGSGAYGIVWQVRQLSTGKVYALKKNFDAFQNVIDAQRTWREIEMLRRMTHDNVIKLIEVIVMKDWDGRGGVEVWDEGRMKTCQDVNVRTLDVKADLSTVIRNNLLSDEHQRYILYQIGKALHYVHTIGLIHRDIKPANVLINEDCTVKLCDFGLARVARGGGGRDGKDKMVNIEQPTIRTVETSNGQCGQTHYYDSQIQPALTDYIATRWYRAPQLLLGSHQYSQSIDVWSYGCLVGQVIRGRPMFPGSSTLNQIERVITWTGTPTPSSLDALRTNFGCELLNMLKRIKPLKLVEWFPSSIQTDGVDLVVKLLQLVPQRRPSMAAVLKHPYFQKYYCENDLTPPTTEQLKLRADDRVTLSVQDYWELISYQVDTYIVTRDINDIKNNHYTPNYQPSSKKLSLAHQSVTAVAKTNQSSSLSHTNAPNGRISRLDDKRPITISKSVPKTFQMSQDDTSIAKTVQSKKNGRRPLARSKIEKDVQLLEVHMELKDQRRHKLVAENTMVNHHDRAGKLKSSITKVNQSAHHVTQLATTKQTPSQSTHNQLYNQYICGQMGQHHNRIEQTDPRKRANTSLGQGRYQSGSTYQIDRKNKQGRAYSSIGRSNGMHKTRPNNINANKLDYSYQNANIHPSSLNPSQFVYHSVNSPHEPSNDQSHKESTTRHSVLPRQKGTAGNNQSRRDRFRGRGRAL